MTKFRPQRGGLKESMEQLFEFDSKEELIEHLNNKKSLLSTIIKEEDISFAPYHVNDERIGWKYTYLVLFQNHTPIGFTDSIPY